MQKQCVFLIGPMGCGKTAVGSALASYLARPFIDSDAFISARADMPVEAIFAERGEDAFRTMETAALKDIIQSAKEDAPPVVATGGGVVLVPDNRELMEHHGRVVYLKASRAHRLARIGDGEGRPLLSGQDRQAIEQTVQALDAVRTPWYQALADVEVSNDSSLQDTVQRIAEHLADDPA